MTEINESPHINKEHLLSHNLCDIPGLSEYQVEKKEPIKEEERKKEIENDNEDKEEYIQDDNNNINNELKINNNDSINIDN